MGSIPARLEQNKKAPRAAISDQLLEMLQHCQATDLVSFLTGDESRLLLEYPMMVGVWTASRDEKLETPMAEIDVEKFMILII
jgi:hypothetical protein